MPKIDAEELYDVKKDGAKVYKSLIIAHFSHKTSNAKSPIRHQNIAQLQLSLSHVIMKTAVISLALVNVVLGNFWYGCLSGDENNMQGSISNKCTYVLYKEGDKACTAGGSNPDDGSGGCPGQNMKAPNWCGETIGLGCPSGWKLGKFPIFFGILCP